MILDTTSKTVEVVLAAAKTTNDCEWTADYIDTANGTTFQPANGVGVSNGTTAVTAVAAPAASTQRSVRAFSFYNADTVGTTVTVRLNDGTNTRRVVSVSLVAGQSLVYTPEAGWAVTPGQAADYVGPGNQNKIINGDMRIDQRNAGASVTPTASAYTLDRFAALVSQSSKLSVQQISAGPVGFAKALRVTSLSAYTVTSTDRFAIAQFIEGLNCIDLNFGGSGAKTVTLSFWVRSSLTGQFGGSLQNSAANRSYAYSYTINSANTWEKKTVTIAGDASGTWLIDTGVGLTVIFNVGTGSTKLTAAGSWNASAISGATGDTSLVATNSATWDITGVKLEVGSVASTFVPDDYATTLQRCLRYYEPIMLNSADRLFGVMETGIKANFYVRFALKRSTPSLVLTGTVSNFHAFELNGSVDHSASAVTLTNIGVAGTMEVAATVSGGTTNNAAVLYMPSSNVTMALDAEL